MTFHSTSLSFIGSHPCVIIKRQDMKTTQEEAANMIVHQVADVKGKEVLVVVDDTDIFIRLLHLCCRGVIQTLICLVGFANA